MCAVQITRFGGPEVLEIVDVPEPEAGPNQQVYDVSTAGWSTPTRATRSLESQVGALTGRTGE
jgi:NADPH:quinone reductase-like Zn-dependent oxidoreductase